MEQTCVSEKDNNFYFQWHITNKCNLRCSHCYQNNYTNSLDMSIQELKDIANKLFPILSKWKKKGDISITGGEPFIRKDLFPFLEYLDSSQEISHLHILSNGTLITDEVIEGLKKFTKLDSIQISLDGSYPETHDRIRGPGNFDKAIKGIRILISNGMDVKIMYTLQRCNMKDIPSLIDLAIKEKISGLTIERLVPMGSSKDMRDFVLSPEELIDIFQ